MANHGWVTTRQHIRPDVITGMLRQLNAAVFKNNLQIEYRQSPPGDTSSWGPHTWLLCYVSGEREWARRVCWLETRQRFEMRHGGGGQFAWWLDTVVLNEVACVYHGKLGDDGIPDRWDGVPGKYYDFQAYMAAQVEHITDPELRRAVLAAESECVPPEFRTDMGESCNSGC